MNQPITNRENLIDRVRRKFCEQATELVNMGKLSPLEVADLHFECGIALAANTLGIGETIRRLVCQVEKFKDIAEKNGDLYLDA